MDNIYTLIKKQEERLISGKPIRIGKYATHNHLEKIYTILAYLNSQHISGPLDSQGREKPFLNIVIPAVNVWYKATDLDEKDIIFRPTEGKNRFKAFIATVMLRNWMRGYTNKGKIQDNFGLFLNEWGYNLAAFGSAVAKFIERDDYLYSSVVPWDRIICDPVDFDSAPVIEKVFYTPDELKMMPFDEEAVKEVLQRFEKRDRRTTLTNQPIDEADEYIGVYELHGVLPLSYLTGKESDRDIYQQQMHIVFIDKGRKRETTGITLYAGKEEKHPYMIAHLLKQPGRTLSIGAVEYLFDTQWMVNHSIKAAKDQLELASKTLLQTSDAQFLGRNITVDVDVGDILITDDNKPIQRVDTTPSAIPFLIQFLQVWKENGRDIVGAYEAITGESMPTNTPYRLGAILNIESHNLFEIMRESKGLYLEKMLRHYVLPYFKKKLNNADEVVLHLEGKEINDFDQLALPIHLAQELKTRLGIGDLPTREELLEVIQQRNNLMGNLRSLKIASKTWKEYFSDLDMDAIEVDITGEKKNRAAFFSLANALLQLIIQNPNALQNPDARMLINQIMDEAGYVSPLQFSNKYVSPLIGGKGGTAVGNVAETLSQVAQSKPEVPGVAVLPQNTSPT
ncbi:MAG: hypothetical protein QW051_01160 [Candidatus Aenigmatarchaeota archaeon]